MVLDVRSVWFSFGMVSKGTPQARRENQDMTRSLRRLLPSAFLLAALGPVDICRQLDRGHLW